MGVRDQPGPDRMRLNFARVVADRFSIDLSEFGFSQAESLPTTVRYRKGDLELNVYHGRGSYEVGFQIGHAKIGNPCWRSFVRPMLKLQINTVTRLRLHQLR